MNMVHISEFILIIIVLSVMDIALAMDQYDRDREIVMIPTPGHPNNPPPSGSSSANQPNPDEILGYVFDQIKHFSESPLSTLRDHLRSDQRIMNGNALRMELVDRCAMVFNSPRKKIQGYLVLACRFLTAYVAVPSLTVSFAIVHIDPDDPDDKGKIRVVFDYLFKNKETKLIDKVHNTRRKIPHWIKGDISDLCQQILGNTADRMVWQMVGCDFITAYV